MSTISPPVMTPVAAGDVGLDQLPPGERYYRHPGDVIRLILWAAAAVLLVLLIELAPGTSTGMTEDLGGAAGSVPRAVREFLLAVVQVSAVLVPAAVVVGLLIRRRWRRTAVLIMAAAGGALLMTAPRRRPRHSGRRFPRRCPRTAGSPRRGSRPCPTSPAASAATVVGKPWLARGWRRAVDARRDRARRHDGRRRQRGVPGAARSPSPSAAPLVPALLVAFGAPNRRPSPATVAIDVARRGPRRWPT